MCLKTKRNKKTRPRDRRRTLKLAFLTKVQFSGGRRPTSFSSGHRASVSGPVPRAYLDQLSHWLARNAVDRHVNFYVTAGVNPDKWQSQTLPSGTFLKLRSPVPRALKSLCLFRCSWALVIGLLFDEPFDERNVLLHMKHQWSTLHGSSQRNRAILNVSRFLQ